ncbi:MAG: hypothetical protein R2912_06315 [Eubacteriales bacterium]
MISRTKYQLDEATILQLFAKAGIANVRHAETSGRRGVQCGSYLAHADQQDYVAQGCPCGTAPVMRYEHNMMESEVFCMINCERTPLSACQRFMPPISRGNSSRAVFHYGIFTRRAVEQGQPYAGRAHKSTACPLLWAAQLHAISSERFGHVQNALFDNWYQAPPCVCPVTLENCAKKHRSHRGERLLRLIEQHRAILEPVEGCMVNFDIWPANSIKGSEKRVAFAYAGSTRSAAFGVIRCLTSSVLQFHQPLSDKPDVIAAYNAAAKTSITLSKEEQIRFAIGQGYLVLDHGN